MNLLRVAGMLAVGVAVAGFFVWKVPSSPAHHAEARLPQPTDTVLGLKHGFPTDADLQGQLLVGDYAPIWNSVAHEFGFLAGNPGPVQPSVFYNTTPPTSLKGAAYGNPGNLSDFTVILLAEMGAEEDVGKWFASTDHCSVAATTKWVARKGSTVHTIETTSTNTTVLANLEHIASQVRLHLGMNDMCASRAEHL